jgi:hypothetical protein
MALFDAPEAYLRAVAKYQRAFAFLANPDSNALSGRFHYARGSQAGQSAESTIVRGRAVAQRRRPGLISVRPSGDWNAHKNNVQTPIALQARLREGGRLGDATLPKLRRWRGVACNALTGSCRQLTSRRRGHTAGKSFRLARKNHPLGEAIRRSRSIPLPEPESLRNL